MHFVKKKKKIVSGTLKYLQFYNNYLTEWFSLSL